MKYLSEKEAEELLEKFGFYVVKRAYAKKEAELKNAIKKVGLPFVMKISGKKIVHKNKIKGVRLDIPTYSQAVEDFNSLKKIKGFEGVLLQSKVKFNKEFLIGIKKTPDFGHVLAFGSGGSGVEEKKDVVFRVLPLTRGEIKPMIKETFVSKGLLKEEGEALENFIFKINHLVKTYPKISELDINPLVIVEGKTLVLDARILFE